MSWQRTKQIIRKEFIQLRRDPKMLRLTLVAPIVQLLVFGYAITSDVRNVQTAVLDMDNTSTSRALADRFRASSRYFNVRWKVDSPREIDHLLDSGSAQLALWIPRGFARDIGSERPAKLLAVLDGTDSQTASVVSSYVNAVSARFSRQVQIEALQRQGQATAALPQVEARVRAWYNPDLKSVNYLVPGVLCMIVMITSISLTSLAVVREREIGTLEQIVVTPIRPAELMVGKITPFVVVGYTNVLMIVAVAALWFRVPVEGSLMLLFALTAVFLTASLGMGLLISTVSRTQQQAMMVSFFVIQPSILLSGFMFPIDNMPGWVQAITYFIPLRYFLEIVRGIFLRGAGIGILWPQTAALAGLTIAVTAASVARFTKTVE